MWYRDAILSGVVLCGLAAGGLSLASSGNLDPSTGQHERRPAMPGLIQTPPASKSVRDVDLVIALDVSGSMSGLIDSAKQRLWDVVNELGQASPSPRLRVAVLSFGNPSYGAGSGFVRIDQPLTTDLDAVNKTLFGFRTNGGSEYVARAVHTAVNNLAWSPQADALRIVFVAGNESAAQDPMISLGRAGAAANEKHIVINTLFCGSQRDSLFADWQRLAQMTDGLYASIDQNAAAVAALQTPMDAELARLNTALNQTYLGYGADAPAAVANQREQDSNALTMSGATAASRVVTKASGLYRNESWDLVDALESGKSLEAIGEQALPAPMRQMAKEKREAFVQKKAEERAAIKAQIKTLAAERERYIAAHKAEHAANGLDDALKTGLRRIAKSRGLALDKP